MIKAVIFDMYETLITLYSSPVYFSAQMAEAAGMSEEFFVKSCDCFREQCSPQEE